MILIIATQLEPIRDSEIMRRFSETAELFELAIEIQRQNIRRRNPELGADEVEQCLRKWQLESRDRPSPAMRPSRRWQHLAGS